MSALVDPTEIEQTVGARRHRALHLGRAVSTEESLYVLHPQQCLDRGIDLRECVYSRALDQGVDPLRHWRNWQDVTVLLGIYDRRLVAMVNLEIPGVASAHTVTLVPSFESQITEPSEEQP